MKVIDLLNKKENGEKVPKHIKFETPNYKKEFYFDGDIYKYEEDGREFAMTDDISIEMALNDEIEIIEPLEEDKKIRKIEIRELKNRIAKAIEYITKNDNFVDGCLCKWEVLDLLNILKGEDKQ